MAIESMVIYESAVYWTYTLLAVFIIVKLIMMVMSIGGFKFGGGGGGERGPPGPQGPPGPVGPPGPPGPTPPTPPAGLVIEITAPPSDAPNPAAVRAEGDTTPMPIKGKITGPAPAFDYIWAIYDGAGHLSARLPCRAATTAGMETHFDLDTTKAPSTTWALRQLPAGNHWIYLMAQLPGARPLEAPNSCLNLASIPEIIGAARREITIKPKAPTPTPGKTDMFIVKAQNPVPGRDHSSPLDAPFGSLPTILKASAPHQELGFDLKKLSGKQGRKVVRVMFYHHPGPRAAINAANLDAWGIKNIKVHFVDGKGMVNYRDNFYEEDLIKDKSRINIVFDYAPPAALTHPIVILAFIAVYDFQAKPGMAFAAADNAMIHRLISNDATAKAHLQGMKMMDFNFDGVVLR